MDSSKAKPHMPGNSRAWVNKALSIGAHEPASTQTGDNKMNRHTKKHPAFGQLGARKQQD